MEELTKNGFVIYPKGSEFALQKVSTPSSPEKLEEKTFSTYQEAIDFAKNLGKKYIAYFYCNCTLQQKVGHRI